MDQSTRAVSSYVRKELATSLRSRHPYTLNLLIGGVEPKTGTPELYWLDYPQLCSARIRVLFLHEYHGSILEA
ncbi:hypothetical protein BJ741DRAFT_591444 [Chytriomyces cf. hyalinus JEL632]|nr:hypothetical protein BJ741DRAFT_591444 [Chytriomyces cf. hyalinus JEL632]